MSRSSYRTGEPPAAEREAATAFAEAPGEAGGGPDVSEALVSEEGLPVFDSWYAKYSSPATRLLLASDPEARSRLQAREIIGPVDDRVPVSSVDEWPFSAICYLECIPRHRQYIYLGTGWIVGPRLIFTVGHNVHSLEDGGYMGSVRVYFHRDGERYSRSVTATTKGLRTTTVWERSNPNASPHDVGAIILPESIAPTDYGLIGYRPLSENEVRGSSVMLAGYPGTPPNKQGARPKTMWQHTRKVIRTRPNQLVYDADTTKGQSGSPVLTKYDGDWISIGFHNYGDASGNMGTWITPDVYELLEQWQKESES